MDLPGVGVSTPSGGGGVTPPIPDSQLATISTAGKVAGGAIDPTTYVKRPAPILLTQSTVLTAADSGKVFLDDGTHGSITVTLPECIMPADGSSLEFTVLSMQVGSTGPLPFGSSPTLTAVNSKYPDPDAREELQLFASSGGANSGPGNAGNTAMHFLLVKGNPHGRWIVTAYSGTQWSD
jgi:hypothetical protein